MEFYPSITEAILSNTLDFAEQHTKISKPDIDVILHARRSLLFTNNKPWIKCTGNSSYDVAMGSYDGAEICELVGMYILDRSSKIHAKCDVGLYRVRKDFTKIFKDIGPKITAEANLKVVNFLDITLNLSTGLY